MPMPLTFSGLRGDLQDRQWYRRSDLIAAGGALGASGVRRVLESMPRPAVKRYGHFQYGQEHMDAVVQAAHVSGLENKANAG
jgi:hypothetical protein